MDRQIIYPGQVPLETDLLKTNQNTMIGLSKLAAAILGVASCVNGFATTQTVVPSMAVLVAPGEIYSMQNLEATAVSSLPADLTHTILKQGISLDARTISLAAPGTAGFSINYLIQASYQDSDTGSAVLPYYNASNPAVAYSGPANSGTAQPTIRAGVVAISAKAGTAATTGTQTTPAPDAGYVGLYVVTVANGASTIVNANISAYRLAPFLPTPFVRPLARFTSNGLFVVPWYVNTLYASGCGGGGGGGAGASGTSATGSGGGGGGAGFPTYRVPVAVAPGETLTVVIGASGAGGATSTAAGTGGGTTTLVGSSSGTLLTLGGGGGGAGGSNTGGGSPGGSAGVGFPTGSSGQDSTGAVASGAPGGNGGPGASGPFGGGGGCGRGGSASGVAGAAASGYGAGGGGGGGYYVPGAGTFAPGGAGAPGFLMLEW